jgi:hypothetical protein
MYIITSLEVYIVVSAVCVLYIYFSLVQSVLSYTILWAYVCNQLCWRTFCNKFSGWKRNEESHEEWDGDRYIHCVVNRNMSEQCVKRE